MRLRPASADVLAVSPVTTAHAHAPGAPPASGRAVSLAPLGLVDMFNGGGAVLHCTAGQRYAAGRPSSSSAPASARPQAQQGHPHQQLVFRVGVRGAGRFLMHCTAAPAEVAVVAAPAPGAADPLAGQPGGGAELPLLFSYDPAARTLEVDVPATPDLECELRVAFD